MYFIERSLSQFPQGSGDSPRGVIVRRQGAFVGMDLRQEVFEGLLKTVHAGGLVFWLAHNLMDESGK
jgi:hypothetical protein